MISKKGIEVTLRDEKVYTVLPLTINDLVKVWPTIMKLEASQDSLSTDLLVEMIDILAIALKGQVAKEDVGDLVDLVDLKTIISAIVGLKEAA